MHTSPDDLDILLVEDNPADVVLLQQMLKSSALKIANLYTTDRVTGAQDVLDKNDVHITLLDLSLPDSFGLNTYLTIKSATTKIPVIILTGLNDASLALEALNQGAQDYLVKGEFNRDLLSRSIQYSLERKHAEEALVASEEKYRQMFYRNPYPCWIYDTSTLDTGS